MKRVIDGVTYNTDTATFVARSEIVEEEFQGRPEERTEHRLYQTRGGAFFIHTRTETQRKTIHGEWEPVQRDDFEPVSRDYAQKWITEGEIDLIDDQVFGEPPEAVEESAPGATLYVRVPASLKDRLDRIAKDEGVSLNAWTMRCVELCAGMDTIKNCLGSIIFTGMALEAEPASGVYSEATIRQMVGYMCNQAVEAAMSLGIRGQQLEDLWVKATEANNYRSFGTHNDALRAAAGVRTQRVRLTEQARARLQAEVAQAAREQRGE